MASDEPAQVMNQLGPPLSLNDGSRLELGELVLVRIPIAFNIEGSLNASTLAGSGLLPTFNGKKKVPNNSRSSAL
jgi:hypothetical protein